MMESRALRTLAALLLAVPVVSGCVTLSSPNSQLYTLSVSNGDAPPPTEQAAAELPVLAVGPVDLPDYLRRPQIVTREGENRVQVAEFDRWAAPLNEQVERVLAENLAARIQHMVVVNYREQRFRPQYRLTMSIERFERQGDGQVRLAGRWTLADAESGAALLTRRDRFVVPVQGGGYEATVAAQSKALAQLADAVSAGLRQHLSQEPKSN